MFIAKLSMLDYFLKLSLNKKTKIYTNKDSIEFLGFMFSSKNNNIKMRLINKTKKKFKYNMKKKNKQLLNDEINYEEYRSVRDSYHGHLEYGNCNTIYRKGVDVLG